MSILGAWEVFNITNDIDDFVDTLFVIEKVEFFTNRIEETPHSLQDLDNNIEEQLKMLYIFKESLPNKVYAVLLKLVRKVDYYIAGIFSNYKQGFVSKSTLGQY